MRELNEEDEESIENEGAVKIQDDVEKQNFILDLDKFCGSEIINKRLQRAPRFKRDPIDFSKYPIEKV